MTLKQLEYFVTIINCGSISAAASQLHISQPPLSMQIRSLEEELGVLLLERSTRVVRPTDAGQKLYEKALDILDLVKETETTMNDSENLVSGKLILGTISSCGSILLSSAIERFTKAYPDFDFELIESNTLVLVDKLKKREIDLAFARTPFETEHLHCSYLTQEPMCAVGKEGFFSPALRQAAEIQLEDLKGLPLIIYRRYENTIREAFRAAEIPIHVKCLCDDARTTLMWAASGLGVCLVPQSASRLFSGSGMAVFPIDCDAFNSRVAIVHREGQYLSPAARKFLEIYAAEPAFNI